MKKIYLIAIFFTAWLCTAQAPEQFVINVYFHVITDDSGNIESNGIQPNFYGEEEMMDAMYVLNKAYAPYNIFFKYRGFDVVADSDLTNHVATNFADYDIPGHFNLFFVNDLGGASAEAIPGNIYSYYTFSALEQEFDKVLVHEIGHCLNLFHTFQNTNNIPCEHVTRDVNDPNYNADIAGDLVEDTAATSGPIDASNYVDCVFQNTQNLVDCQGTPLANVELNYMGYTYIDGCDCVFTPGQVQRMRDYLANVTAPHYVACFTTTEELYWPYSIRSVPSPAIYSTTDNGDGTMTVCYKPWWQFKFQKGFSYVFRNPSTSTTPLYYWPEDWPILYPHQLQLKVLVKEVHRSNTELIPVDGPEAPMCETEPIQTVNVVSTEFIGSTSFIESTYSGEEAAGQSFYSKLSPGMFHFVTKETKSGAAVKTTIYKPKN